MKYFISAVSFFFTSLILVSSQECSSPSLRKEIRQLTQDELARYFNAIKKVHSTRSNDGLLSRYEAFSKTHYTNSSYAHGTPRFLPWHRYFLRLYELELQKVEPTVVLPYWDWSKDYSDPASSPILSDAMMGSNGDSSQNYCVTNGQFANLEFNYPNSHCLQRKYNRSPKISSFKDALTLNSYLNYESFSQFCHNLERAHGTPHVVIGSGYDFSSMYSPNDPIFYLHHAFIDSLWYEWQQRHPNSVQYEGEAYNQEVSEDDSLVTWPQKIQSTFNTKDSFYCYTYSRYYTDETSRLQARSLLQPSNSQNLLNINSNLNNLINPDGLRNNIISHSIQEISKKLESMNPDQAISFLSKTIPQLNIPILYSRPKTIEPPLPLPEAWIRANRLDVNKVRKEEERDIKLFQLVQLVPNLLKI